MTTVDQIDRLTLLEEIAAQASVMTHESFQPFKSSVRQRQAFAELARLCRKLERGRL